jgi:hypothetical protein
MDEQVATSAADIVHVCIEGLLLPLYAPPHLRVPAVREINFERYRENLNGLSLEFRSIAQLSSRTASKPWL